ncbi:hypothetical protein ABFU82_22425 [Nocardioides sp. WV_118_6]
MSDTTIDRYRKFAERAAIYAQGLSAGMQALAEAVARLEVLAIAVGMVMDSDEHVVEIHADGTWHLMHGIPCRPRPHACRVQHAIATADGRLTWPSGRHVVSLAGGAIALGPVVPDDYDPLVTDIRNLIRSFERTTP